MKNSKLRRALLLVASAVLLVCVSVGATLAYLTATTAAVKNTFTVGKVTFDSGKEGESALGLDEANVNEYGVKVDETRVRDNEYKLLPGHEYVKDPTVHVGSESEDAWLFVTVVNEIAGIEAEYGVANATTTIEAQMKDKGWVNLEDNVWYYYQIVSKNADIPVFDKFVLHEDLDQSALEAYVGETIIIDAFLIQSDGFKDENNNGTAADEAWTASEYSFDLDVPTT